jgi:subtilisin family serine protease
VGDDCATFTTAAAVVTVVSGDGPGEIDRQRTRDQLQLFTSQDPDLLVATETGDPADVRFICDRHNVVLAPADPVKGAADRDDPVRRLNEYLSSRIEAQAAPLPNDLDPTSTWGPVKSRTRPELGRLYRLPERRVRADQDLLLTVDEANGALGPGTVELNYFMHVSPPRICPATEPAETGLHRPWPPVKTGTTVGKGVNVVVVDTGWYRPATAQSWVSDVEGQREPQGVKNQQGHIRPYAGHGTFVAGVIKALAPACSVFVFSLHVNRQQHGGGVRVFELLDRLDQALKRQPTPQLINLSAGFNTLNGSPPGYFDLWWQDAITRHPNLVLVAAAGNDSSSAAFYPASFPWAVGVGSLDHDGRRSSFSNHGSSAHVYALGRNLVNVFPKGTYIGHEPPIKHDRRVFTQMLARWSGTSFSAPVVTGLIAAEMSRTQPPTPAPQARDAVLQRAAQQVAPWSSTAKVLMPPY